MTEETERMCEVCGVRPMIGVACTSIPYSCAYCAECARHGADPEWIFEYIWQDCNGEIGLIRAHNFVTWKDGRYITFEQWATWRRDKGRSK